MNNEITAFDPQRNSARLTKLRKEVYELKKIVGEKKPDDCVKTVNGRAPDKNGNILIAGEGINEEVIKQVTSLNDDLEELKQSGTGMPFAFKEALHNIFVEVAYTSQNGAELLSVLDASMEYNGDLSIPVTGVTLSNHGGIFYRNYETEVVATVSPDNATNKTVIWDSSDPSVANITAVGNKATVQFLKAGSSIITVKTVNGGFIDTFGVTVIVPVATGVEVNPKIGTFSIGDTFTLNATVYPVETEDKTIVWTAEPSGVVQLIPSSDTQFCTVTAISSGTVNITATINGKSTTGSFEIAAAPLLYIVDVGTLVKEGAQVNVGSLPDASKDLPGSITMQANKDNLVYELTNIKTGDQIIVPNGNLAANKMFSDVSNTASGETVSDMLNKTSKDNYSWYLYTLTATRDIERLYVSINASYDIETKARAIWKKA